MIIRREMVKKTFLFIFSNLEIVFHSVLYAKINPEIMFLHLCPFLIKIMGL